MEEEEEEAQALVVIGGQAGKSVEVINLAGETPAACDPLATPEVPNVYGLEAFLYKDKLVYCGGLDASNHKDRFKECYEFNKDTGDNGAWDEFEALTEEKSEFAAIVYGKYRYDSILGSRSGNNYRLSFNSDL